MRGVQSRLFGGVLTALLTLGCIAFVLTASSITMGVTFAFTIGTYSLAASIALLMSARQEEVIHQFSQCVSEDDNEDPPQQQQLAQQNDLHECLTTPFCDEVNVFHKRVEPHTSGHHA